MQWAHLQHANTAMRPMYFECTAAFSSPRTPVLTLTKLNHHCHFHRESPKIVLAQVYVRVHTPPFLLGKNHQFYCPRVRNLVYSSMHGTLSSFVSLPGARSVAHKTLAVNYEATLKLHVPGISVTQFYFDTYTRKATWKTLYLLKT